jgi:iron(III) transport system substrate-binding protein
MKRFIIYSIILIFFAVYAFWGAQAFAQQKVSVYTTLDEPLARAVMKAFEQEVGIKVEWIRLSTGEAVARMEAEKGNPQASVWYGGVDNGHIDAKEKGLTIAYESPNAKAIFDKYKDKDRYWTGLYAGPLCYASNINLLKKYNLKAPTSWADLLNPEFKGKIQMANPGSSGTAYNVITTLIFLWGEEKAFDYMKKINQNISQYTRSGSAPGKNAALGEAVVGIGYAHDQVKLKAEGYPLEITFPSEGTGYEIASISLMNKAPQMESGKKLYDWALSKNAASIYASMFVVPFIDVPLQPGAIPISSIKTVNQDNVWGGMNKKRLIDKWNNEVYK